MRIIVNYSSRADAAQQVVTAIKEAGGRAKAVHADAADPAGIKALIDAAELFLTGRSEELIRRLSAEIPLGRLGEPDDVARVMAFLAGPDGGWVSGQVIKANGGRN